MATRPVPQIIEELRALGVSDKALEPVERWWAAQNKCPGCSIDGSNAMGLQGHLADCIYNPMREGA